VNLMRQREISALVAAIALCWSTGALAQKGGAAGVYSTQGPISGSSGGRVTVQGPFFESGSAACNGSSAGDSCSFAAPDGQTETGTCTTIPDGLVCVPAGAMFHYETGGSESQQQGEDR
jgi:hypothetical protein